MFCHNKEFSELFNILEDLFDILFVILDTRRLLTLCQSRLYLMGWVMHLRQIRFAGVGNLHESIT